jgi:hypothetical protein
MREEKVGSKSNNSGCLTRMGHWQLTFITNSELHSPIGEDDCHSAGKEISGLFNIVFTESGSEPHSGPDECISQLHTLFNIHFNIILSHTPKFPM